MSKSVSAWTSLIAELEGIRTRESWEQLSSVSSTDEKPEGRTIRQTLQRELDRLIEQAKNRELQDLPVHAVIAGWAGECKTWRADIQYSLRRRCLTEPMPRFGWFTDEDGWWFDDGNARGPQDVEFSKESGVTGWVNRVLEGSVNLGVMELPEADELGDSALRLGLAVVRDSLHQMGVRARVRLEEMILIALNGVLKNSLASWYEARGAAPLAVVDETRRQIEYTAARRHFVRNVSQPMEAALEAWGKDPTQPAGTLERLAPLVEELASSGKSSV